MNPDGWGVGWWDPALRPEPARYRTTTPMWADQSFRSTTELVQAGAILAATRAATPPLPIVLTSNAPFTADQWLFSLNGYVAGFAGPVGLGLRQEISDHRAVGLQGATDSEVLFGLVLDQLDQGRAPGEALAEVVGHVLQVAPARLNLLLGDGEEVVATACGASLFVLRGGPLAHEGVVVASEPLDDDHEWEQVPDSHLVTATVDTLKIEPLDLPTAPI